MPTIVGLEPDRTRRVLVLTTTQNNHQKAVRALCGVRRLGHEQVATTNIYLHADMTIKENAIAKITPQDAAAGRYQPPDPVLAFLTSL